MKNNKDSPSVILERTNHILKHVRPHAISKNWKQIKTEAREIFDPYLK
jgi:hypothetical protein